MIQGWVNGILVLVFFKLEFNADNIALDKRFQVNRVEYISLYF
jgi:hypothetical protein